MAGPLRPIEYGRRDEPRRRAVIAGGPLFVLLTLAATPIVFRWTADWTFDLVLRDFGLQRPTGVRDAVAFLDWYGPGYGWVWTVLGSIAVAIALPRFSRWPRPVRDGRDVALWLLGGACAALLFYLTLSRMTEVAAWETFLMGTFGISSGGGANVTPRVP